jgi:integrase
MPRKFTLNWDKSNKSWFKLYYCEKTGQRKKKYLGRGQSKTNDTQSYKEALKNWKQFQSTRDVPTTRQRQTTTKPLKVEYHPRDTVAGLVDIYLYDHSKRQVAEGYIALATYANREGILLQWVDTFIRTKAFKSPSEGWGPNKVLNGVRLRGYHQYLRRISLIDEEISFATARLRMAIVKQFYYWCFHTERINELPRNMNSSLLQMRRPKHLRVSQESTIRIMKSHDVKLLFGAISVYRGKYPLGLLTLLALNTGMNLGDITSLTSNHITISEAYGTIKISKTRKKTSVMGEWLLWDITSEYLKEHIIKIYGSLKLFNADKGYRYLFPKLDYQTGAILNHPMDYNEIDVDVVKPKVVKRFTAEPQLNRMFKNAAIPFSVKHLRKTAGTTFLYLSGHNEVLTQKFLGHRPKTIALRHYAEVALDKLEAYTSAIEQELGIDELYPQIRLEIQNYRSR